MKEAIATMLSMDWLSYFKQNIYLNTLLCGQLTDAWIFKQEFPSAVLKSKRISMQIKMDLLHKLSTQLGHWEQWDHISITIA